MVIDGFGGASTIIGRFPSEDVLVGVRDRMKLDYFVDRGVIKGLNKKIIVPIVAMRHPKVRNFGWEGVSGDWQKKVVVNVLPDGTPRGRPYGGVACLNLENDIVVKLLFNLHNGRPENGLGPFIVSSSERFIGKIFRF